MSFDCMSLFIVHYHTVIQHCVTYATDKV